MSNHIFISKSNTDKSNFYCLKGYEDFIDDEGFPRVKDEDSQSIAAKKVLNKKSKSFNNEQQHFSHYIKCNPSNELFNPIQLHSSIKDKSSNNFIDKTCKSEWTFKEVDKHIFNKYIRFLLTGNISWLKDAERDMK